MVAIKELDKIYLEDFDIYVKRYLTYAEIQSIVDALEKLEKWSDRQTVVDLLILTYATNMDKEQLKNTPHDVLLSSGLIEQVTGCIDNLYQVTDAISFNNSFVNIMANLVKNMPKLTEEIKKVADKYANSKK